jgi:hypothetical protein
MQAGGEENGAMADRDVDKQDFAEMALMVRAFQLSKLLQVAAAFELADRVAAAPQPVAKLAADCGADPDMLLRVIRALAAFRIFHVGAGDTVSQTPRSAWFRKDAKPTLHHATRFWTMHSNWQAWGRLEEAVRKGTSAFDVAFGAKNFDYLAAHPEEAALFDLFMQHSPDDRHAAVTRAYDFSRAKLIVDVAGGNGALLAAILTANADAKGLLFDQPAVVAGAPALLAAHGIAGRCRIAPGSFFDSAPAGGDIYTLSQILHDWDDESCRAILANVRAAMGPDAVLLIIERVLDDGVSTPVNFLSDIDMLVLFGRARERSSAEFTRLIAPLGFSPPRLIPTSSPFCILETRPV